jgi:transposase-like protein
MADEHMLGREVDAAVRERAVEFWAEHGTTATATEFGFAKATIRRWVNDAGVKNSTNAKSLEDRRRALASKLLDDVEELRESMFAPATVFHFTAKGEFSTATIDQPTMSEQKQLALTMAILIDKAAVLTGAANVRFGWENTTPEEAEQRLTAIVDDLAERRARKTG